MPTVQVGGCADRQGCRHEDMMKCFILMAVQTVKGADIKT
jgi:hypothetical protein